MTRYSTHWDADSEAALAPGNPPVGPPPPKKKNDHRPRVLVRRYGLGQRVRARGSARTSDVSLYLDCMSEPV